MSDLEPASVPTRALVVQAEEMRWLSVPQEQMMATLKASLYPGATDQMVHAVMDYCRAAGLNVMLRPVHIVPMWIPEKKQNQGGQMVKVEGTGMMRDIIMPGINHYRVQATRTGRYLGLTRPEWGPIKEFTFKGGIKFSAPESVAMAARVKIDGEIVEFWHEERFLECYATAGRDTDVPNAMWMKRPTGQMSKTCEAGALRKAFPELGDYTAEEMEGKTIELVRQDDGSHAPAAPKEKPSHAAAQLDAFAGTGEKQGEAVKGKSETKKAEPKVDLPTEEPDTIPIMPADAIAAWKDDKKWSKAWRWLGETMPTVGPKTRQALTDDYADILWAVNDASPAYQKAAGKFIGAMQVKVPDRVPVVEDEEK